MTPRHRETDRYAGFEQGPIRPPSEANSILLQVTVGCSRNKCTFCGTYKGERFRIKPDSVIMEDNLDQVAIIPQQAYEWPQLDASC